MMAMAGFVIFFRVNFFLVLDVIIHSIIFIGRLLLDDLNICLIQLGVGSW
ncbi:hypothetical protein XaFJ1_GM002109 [Xanthomonas albilineans]|nr:hypothetical protein XaFJ1_GM002109 [Xanthomonas albilineans]